MTESIEQALAQRTQPQDRRTVLDHIEAMKPEIQRSLQSEGAADMLVRHYYTAIRYNELLRQCSAESLVGALLLSAQVRLEPGPLGHVYLVPYRVKGVHEVVWVLGYTGIIELARRGGAVGTRSTVVWDCDEYTQPWEDERGVHFKLAPEPESERKERVGVLVSWKERDGSRLVTSALHVPTERIERARKASPAGRKGEGPWVTDEDAMWRKTGVRAARPFLPLSVDLARGVQADGAVVQGVTVDEGEAVPMLGEGSDDA